MASGGLNSIEPSQFAALMAIPVKWAQPVSGTIKLDWLPKFDSLLRKDWLPGTGKSERT